MISLLGDAFTILVVGRENRIPSKPVNVSPVIVNHRLLKTFSLEGNYLHIGLTQQ